MMRLLAIAACTMGCAIVVDFDRYTAGNEAGATDTSVSDTGTAVEDTTVIVTDTGTPVVEDTTVVITDTGTPVVDTGTVMVDTAPVDTFVCPYDTCASGCTILKEDAKNCGTCGKVCAAGQYCKNGTCTCMPGLTSCSGECVDLNGHHEHCGACTTVCSLESNTCRYSAPLSGYICTLDMYGCPTGRTQCAMNHCFDLDTDETNCGSCFNICARDEICTNKACTKYYPRVTTCPSGYKECPALPGNPTPICVQGSACPG
jgi:hypothetical protein